MEETWTKLLATHPEANFLQSPLWAEANRLVGHRLFVRTFDGQALCLGLIKDARRGRYLEIPGGPLLDWANPTLLQTVFAEILTEAKKSGCVFVRFRPQLENTPENQALLAPLKTSFDLRPAPMHLHAQNTVILDLQKSEDELLMAMRRQTRYEVRRGEKLGLKILEDHSEAAFKEFRSVQLATAKRQNFIPPSLKELLAERTAFSPDHLKLYKVLSPDDQPVAYGLILIYGHEAAYFEAASTDLNRKLPGSTALLWRAIKDLKTMHIDRFNLWGIAPPGVEHHRYSGVTTFKTGFGGRVVEFIPAQDLVINKLRYKLDELVETARKKKRNL
ncbi:peptidoglycan bridge formation glycyltransferase FemA/FemB family protein [Candidatus Saccharibacteria bacterium]|nr:peptidoglycan bridge formation glycyltransferase FemA/FemB family protein [Candidatus Saccharibacteria bacterium]